MNTQDKIIEKIKQEIENNKIVLFMKGTRKIPQCGFSGVVAKILNDLNVEYKDINVLEDRRILEGIKKYSDWPTTPQLYINKKFIGGCDITREMHESGELEKLLIDLKIL